MFTESPETKLVPNLPFADYCTAPGINQSRLRVFDYDLGGCPALYQHVTLRPDDAQVDTKALRDGRRYHAFVLEPDTFDKFYVLRTKEIEDQLFDEAKQDKACKAKGFSTLLKTYKAWHEKTTSMGLEVITQSEYNVLQDMRRALMLNEEVFAELGSCRSDQLEVSAFAGFEFRRGPYEGKKLQLKARFDIVPAGDALIDLKTARNTHPRKFARQAWELGYDIQGAFYQDVANANDLGKKRFGFLAQDKFPPYLSCIHWVNGWLGHGRVRYTKIISDLADAITRNKWPGYESGELEPPSYALDEIEAAA